MRKLMTVFTFAALGAAALVATAGLPSAKAAELEVVHEYPNPSIDESVHPAPSHLADSARFSYPGTDVRRIIASRKAGMQVAGSLGPNRNIHYSRDCFGNLSDGEPTGPKPSRCF